MMAMAHAVPAALLMLLSMSEVGNQIFPELEPRGGLPGGMAWQFQNGPDFYIYYGTSAEDPGTYTGIYFGLHPKFQPANEKEAETTLVAGKSVTWCDTGSATQRFRRDALLDYRHSPKHLELRLHFWIVAATREKLSEMMQSLTRVQLAGATRPKEAP